MQVGPHNNRRNIARLIVLAVFCLVVVAVVAYAIQTGADKARKNDRCAQEATINSQLSTSIARAGGTSQAIPCR